MPGPARVRVYVFGVNFWADFKDHLHPLELPVCVFMGVLCENQWVNCFALLSRVPSICACAYRQICAEVP